jgi:DNA-binding NarL/FixJ family response regulator
MKKDIQILLVDDHQVVRDGLRHMLEKEEDMEIVSDCSSADEALFLTEITSPNIILMDIKMPDVNGIELTRQLLEKQPSCKVIMLTLYAEYVTDAMEAGAVGYLLKDIKRVELTQAIRHVHQGRVVISQGIAAKPQTGYEEVEYKRTDGESLPWYNGSSTLLKEVQMVIPPPIDANKLMDFVSRVEEVLQSRMLRVVGSWQGGTAITIPLPEPTPVEDIINTLKDMSEVETIGEEPVIAEKASRFFKKAVTVPRPKDSLKKPIFITLKNA